MGVWGPYLGVLMNRHKLVGRSDWVIIYQSLSSAFPGQLFSLYIILSVSSKHMGPKGPSTGKAVHALSATLLLIALWWIGGKWLIWWQVL